MDPATEAGLDVCDVTTTGRRSGRPHTIEIWFALEGSRLYLLSGGGEASDWVRNLRADPAVRVRLGERVRAGRAAVVVDDEEDALARRLLVEKYAPRYAGDLTSWGRSALPVAIELAD